MTSTDWAALAGRLAAALHPVAPPLAITFHDRADPGTPGSWPAFDAPMPAPADDGRTGRVSAGCMFWIHGATRSFTTLPADHRNCSVGSYTHGLIDLEEAARGSDTATIVEVGWVAPEDFTRIPHVAARPAAISYGPLEDATAAPDVVLLRLVPKAVMVLSDACPDLRLEGKPQCHIVAVAKDDAVPAASVGCALSRARTGMQATEMTAALPVARLEEILARVEATAGIDASVARYAAADAQRFDAPW